MPKLTTVAPMIKLGIPEISAMRLAESTNQSPPLIISRRPTAKRKTVSAISPPRDIASTDSIIVPLLYIKKRLRNDTVVPSLVD